MKKVPAYGPADARIIAIGEAPGETEEELGRPFVGKAGTALRNWLQEVGIDPESVFYTNLCKYRPPGNKLHEFFEDGGIPNELVRDGIAELINEIRWVRAHGGANVLLVLGNFPLKMICDLGEWVDKVEKDKHIRGFRGITTWRGYIYESTLMPGFKVVPTFHPSYLIQEGMQDHGTFKTDLARVREQSAFPEIRRPERKIILASDPPRINTGLEDSGRPTWDYHDESRNLIRDRLLSTPDTPTTLDIEYLGSKLICVGLTNEKESATVVPCQKLNDILYLESIIKETKQFNAQNSMFDASILEWHYNMPIMDRVSFDTMVCAYCANIELPKDLGYLASIYTDLAPWKHLVNWDLIKKGLQSFETVFYYNGHDTFGQHEIMEEQIKWELAPHPHVETSFRFLMRLLAPLWRMSKRGIRMDRDLMHYVKTTLEGEAAVKNFELMFLAKSPGIINVKSNDQIGKLLYEQLGLPIVKMNPTGPACDDKTLAELLIKASTDEQRKAITLIRQIRSARDLQSKFFDVGFDDDGRMRGTYDPTKTVTGRLASRTFYPTDRGTNQQNTPRDKRARRVYIADKNKAYGYADLEKAESLIVAHLAMDPLMLHDHSPGQNAHRNLGAVLFHTTPEELDDDQYYLAKRTRHAGNYMQGKITFMRNVNQDAHKTGVSITLDEADQFISIYRGIHVGLKRWWRETEEKLYKGRTLYNLLGFPRTFYGHINSTLPEAVAFVPQSTVGQVLNLGLLNVVGVPSPYLEERGIWEDYCEIGRELSDCGFELLQQIHDAIGFQVNEKDVDRAAPLIRRALSIPLRNPKTYEDFKIPVELLLDLDPQHLAEALDPSDPEGKRRLHSNWGDSKIYKKDLELVHA